MAKLVVYPLEAVEVDLYEGDRLAGHRRLLLEFRCATFRRLAVQQPGEAVDDALGTVLGIRADERN